MGSSRGIAVRERTEIPDDPIAAFDPILIKSEVLQKCLTKRNRRCLHSDRTDKKCEKPLIFQAIEQGSYPEYRMYG